MAGIAIAAILQLINKQYPQKDEYFTGKN